MVPVPILKDNYSYFVIDTTSKEAVVVDPADPAAVKVGIAALSDFTLIHSLYVHSAEVCY